MAAHKPMVKMLLMYPGFNVCKLLWLTGKTEKRGKKTPHVNISY